MAEFTVRPLRVEEIEALLDLLDAVAAERRWIASEPPIPRDRWREGFERNLEEEYSVNLAAVDEEDRLIGQLDARGRADRPAEIGMAVAEGWRGRGVGTALMQACVDWARELGVHKLALQVWPHNDAAIRLYEKFGFEREGVLRSHYRRQNGELWDAIVMGLLL
jgi:RimJ/RimL family protein N-acetyltransferase